MVKKSNRAISSRVKGYSITQTKIMNLAISELTENTTTDDVLSFQAGDLLKNIGLGENNHTELRKATLDMIRGIEIPESDGSISQVPVFQKIKYNSGGTVDIHFHGDVLPLLVQAKTEYTKYYFQNIQRLKSGYSIKIYELCKQYQNTKQGYRDLSIEELKVYLDIPLKKYPRYCDFNSRVIKGSVKEVTEKTDLKIYIEPIKKGRSTTGIRFYISVKNTGKEAQPEEQPIIPYNLEELSPAGRTLIADYQMSPRTAVEIQVLATTDEHLYFAMAQFNKKLDAKYKRKEEVDNLPKYSEIALRDSLPTILVSGIVEKEKAKAEEKNRITEVKKKQIQIEEKAKQKTKKLDESFKSFCSRKDLLEVLNQLDVRQIISTGLSEEKVKITPQANKQAQTIFAKNIDELSIQEVFEVLTGTARGFTMSKPKTSSYHMLKIYMKYVFQPYF
ncbi:MAG: replication initiation protein [Colwellia sp.]